jgi:uncharacterized protein (TIGR01777 family)
MKIAVTGASGLIGTGVTEALRREGHRVTRLVRSRRAAGADDAVYWDPAAGEIEAEKLPGHEAVINLAGENIAGLWTRTKKRRIYHSRVDGTRLLSETLAGLPTDGRPRVLLNASAAGYYGDRPPDRPLDEDAPAGDDFMARVVRDWEAAADPARAAGVRVLHLRFGLVLHPDALLLRGMTLATKLGLGATLGTGAQAFPWVTREEIARVVGFLLRRTDLEGPVNVAAPEHTTFRDVADTLARVLRRPRFLRIPAFAIRAAGDLGDALLTSAWLVPRKLESAGYEWLDPRLEPALRKLVNKR